VFKSDQEGAIDQNFHDRLSEMRVSSDRTDAVGRLSVFLRLQSLRPAPQTEAGRLLRLLLLRVSALPAETGCGGSKYQSLSLWPAARRWL